MTNFHQEEWQPAWGIRTVLLGIISLMPASPEDGAGIGSLHWDADERRRLAHQYASRSRSQSVHY